MFSNCGVGPQGVPFWVLISINPFSQYSCPALGRITESVINDHYERYFRRETQEGTCEGPGKSGFGGRVWLPFGQSAPGVETSGLGDPGGSLPPETPHSVMFFQAFPSE